MPTTEEKKVKVTCVLFPALPHPALAMLTQVVVLAFTLISVNAFNAPAASVARRSALKMSFEDELGVINPTGFWDPLNLTKDMDEKVDPYHSFLYRFIF